MPPKMRKSAGKRKAEEEGDELNKRASETPPILPDDILRRVIALATDYSIDEIRLVSHSWKVLVDDVFSQLIDLPTIDELVVAPSGDVIIADFSITKRRAFPVKQLCNLGFDFVKSTDANMDTVRKSISYKDARYGTTATLRLIKCVNKVVLRDLEARRIKYIPNIFRNVQAKEICFDENDVTIKYSETILNLIRQWKTVQVHLIIASHRVSQSAFLLEISDLVDALHIEQFNNRSDVGRYLIDTGSGVDDWSKLVPEMFEKRVSKIRIQHNNERVECVDHEDLKSALVCRCHPSLIGRQKRLWLEMNVFYTNPTHQISMGIFNNFLSVTPKMSNEIPFFPTEIIQKIVQLAIHANHSIDEMRDVSPLWCGLVAEEFYKLSNLPPIDELEITPSADFFAGKGYLIMADFKIGKYHGFPVYQLHNYGFELIETSDMITLRKHLRWDEVVERRTEALCAISRINRVVIRELSDRIKSLPSICRNIRTNEIRFEQSDMTTAYSKALIQVVRQWKAASVYLIINNHGTSEREFLFDLADSVDVLHVEQMFAHNYAATIYRRGNYLFGVAGAEDDHWMQILLDMIKRRGIQQD